MYSPAELLLAEKGCFKGYMGDSNRELSSPQSFQDTPKCRPPSSHHYSVLSILLVLLNVRIMKIFTTVATRCHTLRLKCTKIDFGWGSKKEKGGGVVGRGRGEEEVEGEVVPHNLIVIPKFQILKNTLNSNSHLTTYL